MAVLGLRAAAQAVGVTRQHLYRLAGKGKVSLVERPDGSVHEERFPLRPTFEYQFDGILDALHTGAPMRPEGDEIIANIALMDAIRAVATLSTAEAAP